MNGFGAGDERGNGNTQSFGTRLRCAAHQIQNLMLDEMARDRVSLSCAIVLPLRVLGGAGSPVRPIAIGVPR